MRRKDRLGEGNKSLSDGALTLVCLSHPTASDPGSISVRELPTRSALARLTEPESFWWATGIEDTFITAPHVTTGRTLDEYELTDHYRRWRADLDLMAELGVRCARYGVPWHLI